MHNTVSFETDVPFAWKRRPTDGTYTLQYGTDSLFGMFASVPSLTEGTATVTLPFGTRYFWRVVSASGDTSAVRAVQTVDPAPLPQPIHWYSGASGVVSTGSDLVDSWANSGSLGGNFSQASASLKPQFVDGQLNGSRILHFGKTGATGNQTALTYSGGNQNLPAFTLLTVHRMAGTTGVVSYMMGTTNAGVISGGTLSGGYNVGVYDGTNTRRATGGPVTTWGIYSIKKNQVWRNSAALAMTGTAVNALKFSTVGIRPDNAALFFYGDMAELMLFDIDLPDSVRQYYEQNLLYRYARPVMLPYDTNVCGPQLVLSLPGTTSDFLTYQWSTGAVTPSITITANGTYWLRGTSPFGQVTVDTIHVRGIFPQPQISPAVNQTFCFNRDTLVFHNLTATPGITYTWSDGSAGDSLAVSSGTEVYLTAFDPVSGCMAGSDTVLIYHKTKADFDNLSACPGTEVTFTDLSSDLLGDTITSWAWNFGDPSTLADTSSDTNGVWNYTQSGTYGVYLKITASDGCADSIAKNVVVKPTATAHFTWQGVCYGNPTQFFDGSMPENGTQVTGYEWTFGPGITSSFVNPAVTFDTANVYPVVLKVFTASGCTDTVLLQVPVNKGADAAFSVSDSLCAGQPVNVTDQSQGVNDNLTQWVWRFGNNAPLSGQAPQFAFQGTGNRLIRLTVTTGAGCVDSVQKTVFVRPSPTAEFAFTANGGTPPFTPSVSNQSSGAVTYAWDYGNGFTDYGSTPTLPAFADTGTYTLYLAATNAEGCTDTVSHDFVVFTGDRTLQLMAADCKTEDDFVTYTARVLNKGALEVNRITFGGNLDYNSVLREKWEGTLQSGQVMEYEFNSTAKYFTSADFCCVRIENFNDTLTVQSPDDEICLPLTDNAWFSVAYPTPTEGAVTIDHTLPFADKLSATLCSVDGKVLRQLFTDQSVPAGFGSSTADITDLRAGLYIIRFTYRDKNYSVKVLKK